jgi:septal ring factor EnvC (AmiA/AmiB activator)
MTFFGKFFVLINTVVSFALLTWGASIYMNRVDWTEVQDGDKKLTERTKELNDGIAPAQRDYARMLNATAAAETDVEKRREQIQKRINESDTGVFYELNKGGSLLDENPTDKIKGLNGEDLRGTAILQQELSAEVDNAAAAAKQFDETRKDQSTLSDEIATYEKKSARLKLLLKDLREEEIFLADSRVNWDEQLVTLQKRSKQLQDKLAAIAKLQKEIGAMSPAPAAGSVLAPIVK